MLIKDPTKRITLKEIKTHPWTTNGGKVKLPTEDQNCHLVTITDEDVKSCVKTIPKLNTLVSLLVLKFELLLIEKLAFRLC